jgi:SAM-dependent methyltransferase
MLVQRLRSALRKGGTSLSRGSSSNNAAPTPGIPPAEIQTEADIASLDELLSLVHRVWADYGSNDPYYSVLTRPTARDGQPLYRGLPHAQALERFYASGAQEADFVGTVMRRNGATRDQFTTILEFGCGPGRVSCWLCQDFDRVIGADISPGHLAIGKRYMAERGIANFTPYPIASIDDITRIPPFDAFYSRYVLQHNAPPITQLILDCLLGKMSRGGFAVFQVPTSCTYYRYTIAEHLANKNQINEMELHVFPRSAVELLALRHGCNIVEVWETDDIGHPDWRSHTFVLRKQSA